MPWAHLYNNTTASFYTYYLLLGDIFYMSERYYNFWSIFLVMNRFVKSFTFLVTEILIWYVLLAIFRCGFLNQPCFCVSVKDFPARHSSTLEKSLPFVFMCLWTFLMIFSIWHDLRCIYLMFLYIRFKFGCILRVFCLLLFFYRFLRFLGQIYRTWRKIFVYLNENRLFSSFTFH